jgi:hypothetical protein
MIFLKVCKKNFESPDDKTNLQSHLCATNSTQYEKKSKKKSTINPESNLYIKLTPKTNQPVKRPTHPPHFVQLVDVGD